METKASILRKSAVALLVVLAFFLAAGTRTNCFAAFLRNQPVTVTQPEGETLQLFASGDERYNWLHDQNGFVVIQDANGVYTYARREAGRVVPSELRVNRVDQTPQGSSPTSSPTARCSQRISTAHSLCGKQRLQTKRPQRAP
jgi:hypothetical protein